MPRRAPALMEDLVEEILLRFPPDEPELLVRAVLVCKRWCRLISDPGFRRRFRELHRAPPMLGFFCAPRSVPRFFSMSAVPLPHAIRRNREWHVVDARRGLVLCHRVPWSDDLPALQGDLIVWNPVSDEHWELPGLPGHVFELPCSWTAAVFCSPTTSGGCNDLDYPPGSFGVLFVCIGPRWTFTCVYSSETAGWTEPTSAPLGRVRVHLGASVLVGNALHFMSGDGRVSDRVLKYDLGSHETSLIHVPYNLRKRNVIMTMVDGGLGFAIVQESKLYLWSWGYAGWEQRCVFDIETLLGPIGPLDVVFLADGVAAIFKGTGDVFFAVHLKSRRIWKICPGRVIDNVVPYMSFYSPALRVPSTVVGPRAGEANA